MCGKTRLVPGWVGNDNPGLTGLKHFCLVSERGLEWLLTPPGRPYPWPRAVATSGVTSSFSPSPGTACRTVVPTSELHTGLVGTSSALGAPRLMIELRSGQDRTRTSRFGSSLSHHRQLWDVVQAGVAFPGSRRRSHSRSGPRPSSTERHASGGRKSPPAQPYGRWTGPDACKDYSSRRSGPGRE